MTRDGEGPGGIFAIGSDWVSLDLETTGLDPEQDRIIEIGAVRWHGGRPGERFAALVDPGCPLPLRIGAITGLSDVELAGKPQIEETVPALLDFLGDLPLVGHNLAFDMAFLRRALADAGSGAPSLAGNLLIDTLLLSRILFPRRPSHALEVFAAELALEVGGEIGLARPHRAPDDALVAGYLACRLWREGLAYGPKVLGAAGFWLQPAQEQMPGLAAFAHGLRTGVVGDAAGPAPSAGPGPSAPPAEGVLVPAGPPVKRGAVGPHLTAAFGPDGLFAAAMDGFEVRPEQERMCAEIAGVMTSGGALAVEAGTGVGKSLAYLLPSVAVAEQTGERVVISTHTVTLQDQLVEREFPLLSRALGRPASYAVLKGRSNYLCLRKWDDFFSGSLVADEAERLFGLRVLFWSARTATGDGAELNLYGEEEPLWDMVAGDDRCWGFSCPRARDCFISRARETAAKADVVIANHALVCSDLLADGRLLPEYIHLIIDEAHHLEQVATDHFGLVADQDELARLISNAVPARGRPARVFGGSPAVSGGASGSGGAGGAGRAWPEPADALETARLGQGAQAAARRLFSELSEVTRLRRGDEAGTLELRYGAGKAELPAAVVRAGTETAEALRALAKKLGAVAEKAPQAHPGGPEAANLSRDLGIQARDIEALCKAEDTDWVYWLADVGGPLRLHGAPVSVSAILRDRLWSKVKSATLVSATLAVEGSFKHILGRAGLLDSAHGQPRTLLLESPFDFRAQALLCVPSDLPLPGGNEGDSAYCAAVAAFLADLLPAIGGRSLVLFTSHRMLRQIHGLVGSELMGQGLNLLAQGIDGGRTRLLRALRNEEKAVVFGTSTFWEGIDVKGPQLSCLIIARLPFPRPDEPLFAARAERLEREGQSSFGNLSLPQAVLRLKQGFGRLIRSAGDRGAVVVLDGRIVRRAYGRAFIASLPPATKFAGATRAVTRRIRSWLGAAGTDGVAGVGRAAVTWVKVAGKEKPDAN